MIAGPVEAYAATALLFGVALMFGKDDADVGAIALIATAWFVTYDIGWITISVGGAAFSSVLGALFVLAVLNYMSKRRVLT